MNLIFKSTTEKDAKEGITYENLIRFLCEKNPDKRICSLFCDGRNVFYQTFVNGNRIQDLEYSTTEGFRSLIQVLSVLGSFSETDESILVVWNANSLSNMQQNMFRELLELSNLRVLVSSDDIDYINLSILSRLVYVQAKDCELDKLYHMLMR